MPMKIQINEYNIFSSGTNEGTRFTVVIHCYNVQVYYTVVYSISTTRSTSSTVECGQAFRMHLI